MTKNKKKYSAGAEMRATWEELKAGAVAREKQAGEGPWRFSADGMSTSGNAPSYMGTDPASPEATFYFLACRAAAANYTDAVAAQAVRNTLSEGVGSEARGFLAWTSPTLLEWKDATHTPMEVDGTALVLPVTAKSLSFLPRPAKHKAVQVLMDAYNGPPRPPVAPPPPPLDKQHGPAAPSIRQATAAAGRVWPVVPS